MSSEVLSTKLSRKEKKQALDLSEALGIKPSALLREAYLAYRDVLLELVDARSELDRQRLELDQTIQTRLKEALKERKEAAIRRAAPHARIIDLFNRDLDEKARALYQALDDDRVRQNVKAKLPPDFQERLVGVMP